MLATAKGYYNGSHIVLDTPADFKKGQEVIITYTIVNSTHKKINKSAVIKSLIGAIPDSGKTLAEYRSERLKKYAGAD